VRGRNSATDSSLDAVVLHGSFASFRLERMDDTSRKRDLPSAYRCVLYDSAILSAALKKLSKSRSATPEYDVGTRYDQMALEAALCKLRSLYDFFAREPQGDDLSVEHFGFSRKSLSQNQSEFRNAIHKYAMHLTWERVTRERWKLPKLAVIQKRGDEVQQWTLDFIAHCDLQGLKPNGYGRHYLRYIRTGTAHEQ
jgi:hypothetical protein